MATTFNGPDLNMTTFGRLIIAYLPVARVGEAVKCGMRNTE